MGVSPIDHLSNQRRIVAGARRILCRQRADRRSRPAADFVGLFLTTTAAAGFLSARRNVASFLRSVARSSHCSCASKGFEYRWRRCSPSSSRPQEGDTDPSWRPSRFCLPIAAVGRFEIPMPLPRSAGVCRKLPPGMIPRRKGRRGYNAAMSLETISRVVSNALKSAAVANSGTPDEKGALDVLGGLAALLESRIQLHKHASPTTSAPAKPMSLDGTSALDQPAASAPDDKKRRTPNESGDSYDMK
jgi:hypothetical protein